MCIKTNYKYFIKISANITLQLILVLTCLMPISLLAADDKSSPEINSQTSAPEDKKAHTTNPENKQEARQQPTKTSKNAPRFKPSEEISEDYSVPFPVDI